MKNEYFIKRGNFRNEYLLLFTENADQSLDLRNQGCERITRKEAVQFCIDERKRQRSNPDFSGYASASVYPYNYIKHEFSQITPDNKIKDINANEKYWLDKYIWMRCQG